MQLVVEISEDTFFDLMKKQNRTEVDNAVLNGTLLPKGHGRLKDEDEIIKAIEDRVHFLRKNDAVFMRLRKDIDILGCIPKIRTEVPTVVEADKEDKDIEKADMNGSIKTVTNAEEAEAYPISENIFKKI